MNWRSWMAGGLAGVALATSGAKAQDPAAPAPLLSPEEVHALVETVPPPPTADSAEGQADRAAMLAAQQARTPEVQAECLRDQHFSARLFQGIYGRARNHDNSPRLFALMHGVLAATDQTNETAKRKFQRLRPYQSHPATIQALFSVSGYSYPSGHSMASFTLATVLAQLFPEQADALLARAGQIAQSRVDAGVHYPSDIREGETLGKATAAALLATPAVQAELAEVRAELRLPLPHDGEASTGEVRAEAGSSRAEPATPPPGTGQP